MITKTSQDDFHDQNGYTPKAMSKAPATAPTQRSARTRVPAARLIDPDNVGEQELPSHRNAVELRQQQASENPIAASKRRTIEISDDSDDPGALNKRSRTVSRITSSPPPIPPASSPSPNPTIEAGPSVPRAARTMPTINMDETGSDGFLKDVQVQKIQDDSPNRRDEASLDIKEFFSDAYNIDSKRRRDCKKCKRQGNSQYVFAADVSTLRRHLEAYHRGLYLEWCQANKFVSKLPKDRAHAKKAAQQSTSQQLLTSHLVVNPDTPITYSESTFREAALGWLVQTNQPIQAFDHPAFQNMINIAARATNGVKLPTRNGTRSALITMFKLKLTLLRKRLMSGAVKGKVSATCDGWQASNVDAYFAVTAHWVEEHHPGVWALEMALIGFTQINNSHNGLRLGQVLYKIAERVGIQSKMGHITCDNASNNSTMLKTFEDLMTTNKYSFDRETQHIRCMAHVINLATQAFIGTYSKSKYYDPASPNDDLFTSWEVEVEGEGGQMTKKVERDEVGLIRTISVKEHSSSPRKELFIELQRRHQLSPLHLKGDMPVRWSSTYAMLDRAESLKEVVDLFIYELGLREPDLKKRPKIDRLKLNKEEWDRVALCINILSAADKSQQAFSSDQESTLSLALPALEALHKAWSSRIDRSKYASFSAALQAGVDKIVEYYNRTADTDAYNVTMFLDPESKGRYMRKNWGEELYKQALDRLETLYAEYYARHTTAGALSQPSDRPHAHPPHHGRRRSRMLSDDESSNEESSVRDNSAAAQDPSKPWLLSFNKYMRATDSLGGSTLVRWWGLNAERLPVWAAIARDYLPIMASSVSSERAFSAAGITLSKRRNRLKADIVEALQFLKWDTSRRKFFPSDPVVSSELKGGVEDHLVSDLFEDPDCVVYGAADDIEDVLVTALDS
ncbi:hypothetical protein ONZ45_g10852 [Pleurotus djamor]|nr:hypothetical protein ONZ45_g10852 [Pleurotus djamor]